MGHMQPQSCADSNGCCDDDCELPTASCSITKGSPDQVDYAITNADSAWIVATCRSYGYGTPTKTTFTLSGGSTSGSITYDPTCSYEIFAQNTCGQVNSVCTDDCLDDDCFDGNRSSGLLVEVSGVLDGLTYTVSHYDKYGHLVATDEFVFAGFSAWNHSRFIPFSLETCCFPEVSRVSLGTATIDRTQTVYKTYGLRTFGGAFCGTINAGTYTCNITRSLDFYTLHSTTAPCKATPPDNCNQFRLYFGDGSSSATQTGSVCPGTDVCAYQNIWDGAFQYDYSVDSFGNLNPGGGIRGLPAIFTGGGIGPVYQEFCAYGPCDNLSYNFRARPDTTAGTSGTLTLTRVI